MIESSRLPVLQATYQITTPMFLGGADNKCAEKIRPPSVKGVLRFWWRALAWGRIFQGDKNQALKQLHREEAALFGSAARDNAGGQGVFRLRIKNDQSRSSTIKQLSDINYLLGQGVKCERGYLESGSEFTVCCYPSQMMNKDQHKQLQEALLCVGMLGGLGARSRRGLGSLSIRSLEGGEFSAPENSKEFKGMLSELLKHAANESLSSLPPFSAFSQNARIDISSQSSNSFALLKQLNTRLHQFRTWKTESPNFTCDHDWAYDIAKQNMRDDLPKRTVFGLPHNYFLSNKKKEPLKSNKVFINAAGGRRSSPLLSHIHQFEDGSALIVQTLLQADFLHNSSRVELKFNTHRPPEHTVEAKVDWQTIRQFMNEFKDREVIYGE